MTTSGYSGTPLVKKLGVKAGMIISVIGAPEDYFRLVNPLPPEVQVSEINRGKKDLTHLFTKSRSVLDKTFPMLCGQMKEDGMIWISWPKRSSGVGTDLDENIIREIGLANGLVDVKVCAIDETWSGLKFVKRLTDRK
jgi:hypothetical protein